MKMCICGISLVKGASIQILTLGKIYYSSIYLV